MSECGVKEFKLRELLKIYNGTKYDHLNKGDIPLYGSGGLMSHVNEALYSGEAILLPRKGTLSNIMYVNESFWTVDTMYYAVVNDKLADAFYLYSYLSQLDLSNLDSGSTLPSMTKSAYESIVVKLPDLKIQKAVSTILFNIRKKLEINNQINQELEAMAKTLYDYWFVQFDFPDQNGKPYKSSGGKMVYHPELKREIPEGWGVEKLSSLLKIGKETTNPKKFPNEEFKYYSIPEFDTTGTYSLERGESIKSNKFKVEKNDLLVSKLNPWFNRVIYNLEENAIASTEFIVWKTFNRFEKNFLYQVATGKEFIEYCTRFATGTSNSHKRVSPDIMVGFQIPFEKTHIQKFGEIIDSIRTQVLQNNEQNQELTQLRDWILPMLMNGQVKVE
ncbi:restriction endonuclease subunit S [Streptococcus thermophilus]|nr:restriction endonuclease subunit S [Streptococcus thermophilus]MCE2327875.1 restriction endonuclease subunit S [Streptococcus thermophilus]MCE2332446.1 restriction endonuclease subunit S [Streptococcus thermophilus]